MAEKAKADAPELKLLIDACISPALAVHLRLQRAVDAVHVIDVLPAGASDMDVPTLAIRESRFIVTQNAEDFRDLAASSPDHPGLGVFIEAKGKAKQIEMIDALIERLWHELDSGKALSNRVFEITADLQVKVFRLP